MTAVVQESAAGPITPGGAGSLAVTGMGVLAAPGVGVEAFAAGLRAGKAEPAEVTGMFDESLPEERAFALPDFRVRDHLGRKGTSFFDRSTALALVACTQALADTGYQIDDDNRHRVGVVMGTTAGSVKSTSDYSRETFVNEKPYLVNPLIFPNAVMNSAAGQTAIWHKLRGVNATVAGGQIAVLSGLRYARNALRCGYADALVVCAAEEYSPHMAWANRLGRRGSEGVPGGEGAAAFFIESADAVYAAGRRPDAEILAIETETCAPPGGRPDLETALRECVERTLVAAGIGVGDVSTVVSGEGGVVPLDRAEDRAIRAVVGDRPERLRIKQVVGECHSAGAALGLAAVLARHRGESADDGRIWLLTATSLDGAVGAAVIRGWSR